MPRSGNVGVTYNRGKFGATFDVNYTGAYPFTVVSTQNINTPQFFQLISYRKAVTTTNLSFNYRVMPNATVYLSINNLAAKGYDRYLQTTDRPREHIITPRSFQVGVTGTF